MTVTRAPWALGSAQQLLTGTSEKANVFLERGDKAFQKLGRFGFLWASRKIAQD